ncbi:MAG: cohesin domain-containing protein [Saprospiraceae bacterium]|nr:cohesin domain-containing protein [Saprospiraceae bacterium]
MSYRIFFWKKRGGATIVLLAFLSCATNVLAHTPYLVNCGQLTVVITPRPYTGSNDGAACTYCCSGPINCERIEYEVFLRANDAQDSIDLPNNGNFNLAYSELYISLKLTRGSNSVASAINLAGTENCLASYLSSIPDGSYETKLDEDEVTLHISAAAGDTTPNIPFQAFLSNGHLFSIIVDAFPGDSLGISCNDFTYYSAEDSCSGNCSDVSKTIYPMPSVANTAFSISLGNMNCQPEEYVDLPVTVSSSIAGMDISLFDFAIVISTNAQDGFFAAPEFIDILAGTSPNIMIKYNEATGQYVVKLRYTAQSWSPLFGTDIQLGTIRIYRPPVLCQGYTIVATLVPGRIRLIGGSNSGCRAIQTGSGTSANCSVSEMPVCSEDFNFNISTEEDLEDCSTLKVYATLSWDTLAYGNSLQFNQLRSILSFDMDNGVSIADVALEGLSCPGSGNDPVLCHAGCHHYSGNTVELCINVGSPITVSNNARIVVTFDAPSGCIQGATVRKMTLLRPDSSVCQPILDTVSVFPYCSPMMENFIRGDIATELGCWIEEVLVEIVAVDTTCNTFVVTGRDGLGNAPCEPFTTGCICDIATAGSYEVTPFRNDNPLNGVTTYDLVLISQHILGARFDSPYKMIAADANKTGSITSFDIIEIRKLILGIYDSLPMNTSWRFVPESFEFPNLSNPFQTSFPEKDTISALPDTLVDFIGIKIGDVNYTAITDCYSPNPNPLNPNNCHAFERPADPYPLREPRRVALKSGDYYTLPVHAGGEVPLIAFQSAFRFDPTVLELISPSLGDAPGLSGENFNLAQSNEGIIRTSWFAQTDALEEELLMPGQILFNLTFRVKQDFSENEILLSIDESLMPNLGWAQEGTAYSLQTEASSMREEKNQPELPVWVRCRPNPSPGEVVFDIVALPQPHRAQITVFDAFGRRMWWRDLGMETGPTQVYVPEAASWPNSVYHWELRFDKQKSTGTFIRQ